MEVKLLITHGKSNIKEVILSKETIIGRGAECNLKIASSQVSRRHCRVMVTENSVLVRDLGSANGTILNGKPVPQNQDIAVTPGNALVVGPLKFVVQFKPPVPKGTAPKKAPSDAAAAAAAAAAAIQGLATPQESDTETVDYVPGKKKPAATSPPPAKPNVPPPDADDEQDIFHEEPTLTELPETSLEQPVNPLAVAEAADEPPDTEFDIDMSKAASAPINPLPEETPTIAFTPEDEAAVGHFPGEETLNDGQFAEDTIREQPVTFAEASDEEEDEEEEVTLPPVKEKKKWGLFSLFRRKKAEPVEEPDEEEDDEEPAAESEVAEQEATASAEAGETAEASDEAQDGEADEVGPPAEEDAAEEPAAEEEEGVGKSDDDALKDFLGQF